MEEVTYEREIWMQHGAWTVLVHAVIVNDVLCHVCVLCVWQPAGIGMPLRLLSKTPAWNSDGPS